MFYILSHFMRKPVFAGAARVKKFLVKKLDKHLSDTQALINKRSAKPETLTSGFLMESDINCAIQAQEMIKGLKFGNKDVEGFYYL